MRKEKTLFLAGLLDLPADLHEGVLRWYPDCVEAAGLLDLHALARALCERIRVLGEVQHMLRDEEVAALANNLATAAITAARMVHAVARRMHDEEVGHADH